MLDRVKPFPRAGAHSDRERRAVTRVLGGLAFSGLGLGAYTFIEPYLFRLNHLKIDLPIAGAPLDVLHVSDIHMTARTRAVQRWLGKLPDLLDQPPDLVLATGDLTQDDSGIDPVVEAFAELPARVGRFYVLGSHDYYQSKFQAYTKYFTGHQAINAPPADTDRLETGLKESGWMPVTNSTELVESDVGRIRVAGVDDPYLNRHRTEHIRREPGDVLAIGLMHAPDVVSEYALAGFDLVLAGHTHGGQVRFPGFGAVVTNSSLPAALAGGLNLIGQTWLHVSPGLGNSPFSPIRFNCRPEATLLQLRPAR
jgi:uncharacterized protein